mgnify:CR=1 FL=1
MAHITTEKLRDIIDDFATEIKRRRRKTAKPEHEVIDFRGERADNFVRDIWVVPVELLRFRKDNGRISSDVLSHEKNYGPLSETNDDDQKVLGEFLSKKDAEKTKDLKNSLFHGGQQEPAIITCDGFLINGNRRKLALQELAIEHPGEEKFRTMKVVILPGKDDEGGQPTLREIEQIENRYQLQSDGKAEYYNFDRALSIRRKIDVGISLEEQLRDDPNFANLPQKEFKSKMKKLEDEYLGPLKCVDEYLEQQGRSGLYDTVSEGRADREGRWQAFRDYHNHVEKKLNNEKNRIALGIEEDEIGKIKDAAFKIIRKREIPGLPKVHAMMRNLPKWLKRTDAKKELLKLSEIDHALSDSERYDKKGTEFDPRTIDKIWGEKYATEITRQVKKVAGIVEFSTNSETPLTLLDAALKKLNHEQLDLNKVKHDDETKTVKLIRDIRERVKELEGEFYEIQKNAKKDKKPKRGK